ncbi:MAG TPA: hypothetical protein PKI11_20980 [Candidatus Hydrogenedentes bacterium]|nr:hypothetical protein [Candidatus Hydrogenedentota bacterium]HNT89535.1 hypothetical protein [Candidatus Hydrogenedentota bacterium]
MEEDDDGQPDESEKSFRVLGCGAAQRVGYGSVISDVLVFLLGLWGVRRFGKNRPYTDLG